MLPKRELRLALPGSTVAVDAAVPPDDPQPDTVSADVKSSILSVDEMNGAAAAAAALPFPEAAAEPLRGMSASAAAAASAAVDTAGGYTNITERYNEALASLVDMGFDEEVGRGRGNRGGATQWSVTFLLLPPVCSRRPATLWPQRGGHCARRAVDHRAPGAVLQQARRCWRCR